MGGSFRLNSCLCFNLRTGTLLTLCLCLVVSIVECIEFLINVALLRFSDVITIMGTLFCEIVPTLVFLSVPFVVGLFGTLQRKPQFLMVAILDIFILTGSCLPGFQIAIIYEYYTPRNLFKFVELLILWYFGLVWYSYFLELNKSIRARSEAVNSS